MEIIRLWNKFPYEIAQCLQRNVFTDGGRKSIPTRVWRLTQYWWLVIWKKKLQSQELGRGNLQILTLLPSSTHSNYLSFSHWLRLLSCLTRSIPAIAMKICWHRVRINQSRRSYRSSALSSIFGLFCYDMSIQIRDYQTPNYFFKRLEGLKMRKFFGFYALKILNIVY